MEVLATYSNYRDFKQALDNEMYGAVESFVKIGYLLQYAEETNIVNEGGYNTVNEFAKAEYGIDATQVSRFINIHKRFGIPGEPRLQERYQNHGVAKLGIMLTLPDSINEEISSEYSKADIKVIQEEVKAEQQVTDLEVMMEQKDRVQQSLSEPLRQVVYQLIHDYPAEYELMYKAYTPEELCDVLTPNGETSYTIRIPGAGKMMVFMKAEHIVVINIRSNEKETYEWQQFFSALQEYVQMGPTAVESWENVFNEKSPLAVKPKPVEKPENHNVQQSSKTEPKKESKKESKVKVATPKPVKKEEPVKTEPEEQLPGQDSIMNHPELLPEDMKETQEVLTGEVEDVEKPENNNVQQASEEIAPVQENSTIKGYKAAVHGSINRLENLFNEAKWDDLIVEAEKITWRVKQIKAAGGR